MQLEELLTDLIKALNRNTNTLLAQKGGGSKAKAGEEPATAAKKKTVAKKKVAAKKKAPAKKKRAAAGVTKKDVSDLILSVANDVGRETAVDILAEFDATKVAELDEADYKPIVKKLKAALEAGAEAEDDGEEDLDEEDLDFEDEEEETEEDDDFFDD